MRLTDLLESSTLLEYKKVMHTGDNFFVMAGSTNAQGNRYWIKGASFDQKDLSDTTKYSTIDDARKAAEEKLKGLTQ
jgi:hypothetical protein